MPREKNLAAAQTAIEAYEDHLGEGGARDVEEGLIDVITDLLHFAEREGVSAKKVIRLAKGHYEDERGEEDEDEDEDGGED
jgi:hypothetical protein